MTRLSISKAWDETRAILVRDGKLLATVAAALLLLPQAVAGVVMGGGNDSPDTSRALLLAIVGVIGVVGQLAIAWLALGGGGSVGEGIRHGLRRTLPFLGAILILAAVVVLLAMVAVGLLMAAGMVGSDPAELTPGQVVPIVLLVAIPMLFISVRLLPTVGVAAAESGGPIRLLKRSWALTRGHFLRLFGFLLAFLVAALVVTAAAGVIGGLIVRLLFETAEPFSLGALVLGLVNGLVQAGLILVYVVMLARIYVQLSGQGAAEASVPSSAEA